MTIAIAFNSGAYGTYLEWCLTTLTSAGDVTDPLTALGNSHYFKGKHLLNMDGWSEFLSSGGTDPFARFHPKTLQEHNLSDNLDFVCRTAQSVIYLYPDHDHVLLCVNNLITKVWDNFWTNFILTVDPNKIYQNWPINKDTPSDKIPQWIKREFLSYYYMPSWFDSVEWYHPHTWSNDRACVVTTRELLFDFESTLHKIQKHCDLDFVRPISSLIPTHQKNLQKQAHLQQDQLCKQIIDAVLNNINLDWDPLPLGSEFWLQWELRNQKLEIRCDGLNEFPTNSLQLSKLLYTV